MKYIAMTTGQTVIIELHIDIRSGNQQVFIFTPLFYDDAND